MKLIWSGTANQEKVFLIIIFLLHFDLELLYKLDILGSPCDWVLVKNTSYSRWIIFSCRATLLSLRINFSMCLKFLSQISKTPTKCGRLATGNPRCYSAFYLGNNDSFSRKLKVLKGQINIQDKGFPKYTYFCKAPSQSYIEGLALVPIHPTATT